MNSLKIDRSKFIKSIIAVIVSSVIYTGSMNIFVHCGQLYPGGFSGISILISRVFNQYFKIGLSFGVIYFSLNIIITFFVYKYIGKWFAIFSVVWFSLTSVLTDLLPKLIITYDPLLIAVFGGILNGLAISIALRNNASSGGFDFIAIYSSIRYNIQTWNYILIVNSLVIVVAGFLFGWNQALYSIIFQFSSTQVIKELHTRYKLTNLFIITTKPDKVCNEIFSCCRHGITKIWAEGCYKHQPRIVLFMTINTFQLQTVINACKRADDKVFINVSKSDRIIGNYYQLPLE